MCGRRSGEAPRTPVDWQNGEALQGAVTQTSFSREAVLHGSISSVRHVHRVLHSLLSADEAAKILQHEGLAEKVQGLTMQSPKVRIPMSHAAKCKSEFRTKSLKKLAC
jgi:hypothetical protein